jgi:hypothetical protein
VELIALFDDWRFALLEELPLDASKIFFVYLLAHIKGLTVPKIDEFPPQERKAIVVKFFQDPQALNLNFDEKLTFHRVIGHDKPADDFGLGRIESVHILLYPILDVVFIFFSVLSRRRR